MAAFAAALSPVRLTVEPGACAGVPRGPRLRLVEAGGVTQVVLERPGEAARARRVPWLEGNRGSLELLAQRGRLGSLAVLVHGLLAERTTPASGEPPVLASAAVARATEPRAALVSRREVPGLPAVPEPPSVSAVREVPRLPEVSEVPEASEVLKTPEIPETPDTPEVSRSSVHPEPPDAEPAPALAPLPEPPELEPAVEIAAPLGPEFDGPTPAVSTDAPPRPAPDDGIHPELLAGLRLRGGSTPAASIVAAAARGPFSVRLLFESAAVLDLQGRPIEHQGGGVGARYGARLATLGPAALDAGLGADLVLLGVARTEPGSARHFAVEPVAAAGLRARLSVVPWLAVVLEAEVAASLAPPRVKVPEGPETALGAPGGRFLAGLELR